VYTCRENKWQQMSGTILEAYMSKPKILVIDDEQSILKLVSAYLRPEGY